MPFFFLSHWFRLQEREGEILQCVGYSVCISALWVTVSLLVHSVCNFTVISDLFSNANVGGQLCRLGLLDKRADRKWQTTVVG